MNVQSKHTCSLNSGLKFWLGKLFLLQEAWPCAHFRFACNGRNQRYDGWRKLLFFLIEPLLVHNLKLSDVMDLVIPSQLQGDSKTLILTFQFTVSSFVPSSYTRKVNLQVFLTNLFFWKYEFVSVYLFYIFYFNPFYLHDFFNLIGWK